MGPDDLSEREKEELIERARYLAFKQQGAVAKYTLFTIGVGVLAALLVLVFAALLFFTGLMPADNEMLRGVIVSAFIGLAIFVSLIIKNRRREKILAPFIEQLLKERADSASRSVDE